ncbi:uncharacterized protein [Miscanthus floridulus]|uniref:uncharacterized protein n=1 Tax=Miscanthus floridulus TaxID=154761 RepID=UPI003458E033
MPSLKNRIGHTFIEEIDENSCCPTIVFGLAPTEPSSDDPQDEPILVEITNASMTIENEPDSPLNDPISVESDSVIIDTQIVDFSVRHTTDDTNAESSELIQPDALNLPALSYSFNLEEYLDEDEISSSATSSKEALSEETRNQTLKVKKAQRNLSDRETLLAKGNFNRHEAKELTKLIDHLKNSTISINSELSQLEVKRAELERELENVKSTIDRHKCFLAQVLDAIKQKK